MLARPLVLRTDAGDAMIESPLSMPVVFHLGPVPITAPVLVTWAIMALLAGGSWLLTRRLTLASFRRTGGAGTRCGRHLGPDP